LFRRANDRPGLASTLDDIGRVHYTKGHYRAALEHFTEALEIRQELGDKRSVALSLSNMGKLLFDRGDFDEALQHFHDSLALRREIGDRRGIADSMNSLGVLLAERGDYDDALKVWSESSEVAKMIGDRLLEGVLLNNMGETALRAGRLDDAQGYLSGAAAICDECAERRLLFEVTRNLGQLALKRHDSVSALEHMERALELAQSLKSPVIEGIAWRGIGEVHAHSLVSTTGNEPGVDTAERAFRRSIEVLQEVGHDAELGRAMLSYGSFLLEQGLLVQAKRRLTSAHGIFGRLGMKLSAAKARDLLNELD
jgi:tetratricopeptide (TPR) repeat protein